VRVRSAEEDLVVLLDNLRLVHEHEFRDQGADLQLLLVVQVRDVAYDEVPAVEPDGVALVDEAL
jgi:hypothetical protein